MITIDELDAIALRKAAKILEVRAKNPRKIFLRALVKALRNTADDIEVGKMPVRRRE